MALLPEFARLRLRWTHFTGLVEAVLDVFDRYGAAA
jgi:hypothetical protein